MGSRKLGSLVLGMLCAAAVAAPASAAVGVSAAYFEGRVAFRVDHPSVAAVQVQVLDDASGAVVFDSGVRRGQQVVWPPGSDLAGRWRYVLRAWDEEGELVATQVASSQGLVEIASIPFEVIPDDTSFLGGGGIGLLGNVDLGSPSVTGDLELYRSGITPALARLYTNPLGGSLDLLDENSSQIIVLEPDVDATGGFLSVNRSPGQPAFLVDGNNSGSGQPEVIIAGTSRTAIFDMGLSGDASVALPASAISAAETLDEAGVASTNDDEVVLSNSLAVLLNRSITAPVAGHVIAFGSVESFISHSSGTLSDSVFGVSDDCDGTPTIPPNLDLQHIVPAAAPGGTWHTGMSPIGLFTVSAGTTTFCLNGRYVGAGSAEAFDLQLTLLFVAPAHGSVITNLGGEAVADGADPNELSLPADPPTLAEIEAERQATEDESRERIERELAALQARLAEVRARFEEQLAP